MNDHERPEFPIGGPVTCGGFAVIHQDYVVPRSPRSHDLDRGHATEGVSVLVYHVDLSEIIGKRTGKRSGRVDPRAGKVRRERR